MTFLVFIAISAVLWVVQSLNEEVQRDIRCTVRITNVPDSVTRVTPIPEAVNVSVRARGTQLLKYWWKQTPTISIDYRIYKTGNKIQFGESAMRAFFHSMVGQGSQVLSVTPDTLTIAFTSEAGVMLPVRSAVKVVPAPQYSLVGRVRLLTDSVEVFSLNGESSRMTYVPTQQISLIDIDKSQEVKVPLDLPPNSRAIPDSVKVSFQVEPLISKVRKVVITPVNVPAGMNLITVPSQVEVYYMVPMSLYKKSDSDPRFRVEADYRDIRNADAEKIPIELVGVPLDYTNVYMSADSVDYILEQK